MITEVPEVPKCENCGEELDHNIDDDLWYCLNRFCKESINYSPLDLDSGD